MPKDGLQKPLAGFEPAVSGSPVVHVATRPMVGTVIAACSRAKPARCTSYELGLSLTSIFFRFDH